MKGTGIMMSGNHPKLILDRIKTQTRRTQGLDKYNEKPDKWNIGVIQAGNHKWWSASCDDSYSYRIDCPYGQVGDRLWVRETFWNNGFKGTIGTHYKATCNLEKPPWKWRPSIHMPRWASRITLEITEVRVERLNQMTEADVTKEGVDNIVTFMLLWDRLNKKRGYEWKSNCWVWVITFTLCQ